MKALLHFGLLTDHMLARYMGVGYSTINKRLNSLKDEGFIDQKAMLNANMCWFIKAEGVTFMRNEGVELPEKYVLVNSDRVSVANHAHTMAVNHVAISLMSGPKKYSLDQMLTEPQMKRMFPNAQFRGDKDHGAGTIAERSKLKVLEELKNRTITPDKITTKYPELWIPTTRDDSRRSAKQFSPPDLVINNEHLRTGSNRTSVAIEVELHTKYGKGSEVEYEKIMETYRQNTLIYAGVVWYIAKPEMKKRIEDACIAVGFPIEKLAIHPLFGKDGLPYHGASSF